jgi:hypothetical protein
MTGTPYLIDRNVLLRWESRMIAIILSLSPRLMLLFSAVLCSATRHRTLPNSGTLVLVHLTAMDTGFLPKKPTVGRGCLKTSCGCCRTVWLFTKNGATCLLRAMSPGFMCTMRDWWPPCEYTGSAGF